MDVRDRWILTKSKKTQKHNVSIAITAVGVLQVKSTLITNIATTLLSHVPARVQRLVMMAINIFTTINYYIGSDKENNRPSAITTYYQRRLQKGRKIVVFSLFFYCLMSGWYY